VFGISELGLLLRRRAASGTSSWDRGSLRRLWLVMLGSIGSAFLCARLVPWASLGSDRLWLRIGVTLFCLGVVLRWYAIIYLGRLFTVDVAIAADHRVIDSGPYRYLRHPSYTGLLLVCLGLGVGLANWIALLVITVPITLAIVQRLRIEEAALTASLGQSYRQYANRTARLVPFIY
jgi:protein-S-isoprenylcysteine O-methyltransferase